MTHCQHLGCTELNTIACFYPDNETQEPDYYYCTEHAPKEGFCYGCGYFWSGVERFDFATAYGGIEGLCENCDVEIRSDLGEFDEHYDWEEYEEFDSRYAYYG